METSTSGCPSMKPARRGMSQAEANSGNTLSRSRRPLAPPAGDPAAPARQRPGRSPRQGVCRQRSRARHGACARKRKAERLFEIANSMADRRGAEIERLCCELEAAGADGHLKRLQREQLRRSQRGGGSLRLPRLKQAPRLCLRPRRMRRSPVHAVMLPQPKADCSASNAPLG